jgi:hypothetical protein
MVFFGYEDFDIFRKVGCLRLESAAGILRRFWGLVYGGLDTYQKTFELRDTFGIVFDIRADRRARTCGSSSEGLVQENEAEEKLV